MKGSVLAAATAAIVAAGSFSPAVASAAEFIPLGSLDPAQVFSGASAISADGSTVVGISMLNGKFEGYRWTRAGGMVSMGLQTTSLSNLAGSVSANGTYVAGDWYAGGGSPMAFRHTQAGGPANLGFMSGYNRSSSFGQPSTTGNGISGDGLKIVGSAASDSGDGTWHSQAFVWTAGVGFQGLGHLGGAARHSSANAITPDGLTIVGSSDATGGSMAWRRRNAGLEPLGDLPGGSVDSSASAVSPDGATVVGTGRSASGREAFRWTESGIIGLGDLPGGIFESRAMGVSGDGSIVVGHSSVATTGANTGAAFIWDAEHGMRSLQGVLTDMGVDLTGWHLRGANAISADGTTIVGGAMNPQGALEAFLVVIPEPGSTTLIGLVGATLLARRTRRSP